MRSATKKKMEAFFELTPGFKKQPNMESSTHPVQVCHEQLRRSVAQSIVERDVFLAASPCAEVNQLPALLGREPHQVVGVQLAVHDVASMQEVDGLQGSGHSCGVHDMSLAP